LKAIAEKLIPGIPKQTRISLLQQTAGDEEKSASKLTVLEEVVDRASSKTEIQHEIDSMTSTRLDFSELRICSIDERH